MKKIIPVFLLMLLTACAVPKVTLKSTFNEQQAAALLVAGKNTIKGSALIRQNNGGVVTCAGTPVYLVPVTEYATERMLALYGNTNKGYFRVLAAPTGSYFENENTNYRKQARVATCDAQGFFKFEEVADGDFYVTTSIQWRINPYVLEGGALMSKVSVEGGVTRDIVLNP